MEEPRMDQSAPPDSWKQDGWIPLLPAFLNNRHLTLDLGCLCISRSCGSYPVSFSSAWLQSLPQNSLSLGCLRNFQLDLKPWKPPFCKFWGVSLLKVALWRKGIHFSQEGGHIILGKEQFGSISVFIALILKNLSFS